MFLCDRKVIPVDDLVETIIGDGDIKFSLNYSDHLSDQGVNIAVLAVIDDDIIELLRFDCFDHQPHYHYGPSKSNKRFMLDQTTEGDPVEWALLQIGENLPAMLNRSGYVDISNNIDKFYHHLFCYFVFGSHCLH